MNGLLPAPRKLLLLFLSSLMFKAPAISSGKIVKSDPESMTASTRMKCLPFFSKIGMDGLKMVFPSGVGYCE